MAKEEINGRDFSTEFHFTFSRSSGPGGQHVNKVSTKVELRFNVRNSALLSEEEKSFLLEKHANKITNEGELVIVSQSERSQLKNKEATIEKFYLLLKKAFTPRKKRKPTRPPAESIEKRLEEKRIRAELKEQRKKV